MNLPNILTIIRFCLIPIFILVFFSSSEHNLLISSYIFILAGITDVLDGYIARKYNLVTKWGQAMDPLADKSMQLTVLICFTIRRILPLWAIVVVAVKELCMVIGGIFLYTKKEKIVIPANKYGKFATIMFYIAILAVAFGFIYGRTLVYLAIIVTIYAFIRYVIVGLKTVKEFDMKKSLDKSY
ncbi:CDP-diacylglycerol--glycerol-3-phosphate 3-phosphatidyltransferase [Natronincola ferrireducens]|uniref:CDP-diacylglycerol--glycerol-3-phosphate 3-phosphatidyltransferase n=1 Tax=Natronincola ferrireducens TaxID=393762 RepID=A0A1G8ZR33_9FIRM|nr:CDP-diacylglycerol--glycerol-3-phosphate 3-phosphatidyltransferase [Natronincola ferrireducens]SDK17511.1 CDP-diacylglycerol--glycerol-3-phosphate 3-phosphatidyltransferase [Natronincola ferrireducens]